MTTEARPGCPRAAERQAEGYLAWHAKAERYAQKNVEQIRCDRCGLWTWPDERCKQFKPASAGN